MSRATLRRTVVVAITTLLWLAGLGVTWLWFSFSASGNPLEDIHEIPGLGSEVRVEIDSLGVPSIFAADEADAWAALGYLHAQDRIWNMELFRRVAEGRLAELFGPPALQTDRFTRTLGLRRAAERAAAGIEPEERRLLEAYARGVNARLAAELPRPPEMRILGFEPEPWDVPSILAIGMVMNLDLAVWRDELGRFRARRVLPPDKYGTLLLGPPEWGPTILDRPVDVPVLPDSSRVPRDTARAPAPASADAAGPRPPEGSWDPLDVLGAFSVRVGSNAWVVSGERTADGAPLLANDMHLALRAPALWYLAGVHASREGLHVAGFTLPGVPGVVVGHNRNVAWGFTNGMVDDMDFVVEETGADGETYQEGDAFRPFSVRTETILVRGSAPDTIRIRETVRGPVMSDVIPGLGATLSALWVPARVPYRSIGILALDRARSVDEMHEAISGFSLPHQNVVFAGRDGRIAYQLGGSIPIRDGWDGSVPAPAAVVGPGWRGFWPPEAHPSVTDPRRGYVVTANNLQAPGLYGVISSDYAMPFRALRITQALEVRRDWTAEETYELQHDIRSLLADRSLPLAIESARRIGADSVAAILTAWGRRMEMDSRAAPLFQSWLFGLRVRVGLDEFGGDASVAFFPLSAFLHVLEEGDASPWVDDVRTPETETLAGLSDEAMRSAITVVAGRQWGAVQSERHAHPLGEVPLLQRIFGFTVGPDPAPGGSNTVRPDDYRLWTTLDSSSWIPPWTGEYGPSERFVARVRRRGIEGEFLIPTGQSGSPFSPHYRDLYDRWRRSGPLVPIPLDRATARARSVTEVVLEPRREDVESATGGGDTGGSRE